MPYGHMDPGWVDRPWWGVFGWLMPLLILALVALVMVWAVTRTTRTLPSAVVTGAPSPAFAAAPVPFPTGDGALERARMRYASGEIGREEFLQVARDLGAPDETQEAGSDG
ncbi:MAG: hypothetical protein ACM3WR_00345 [Solirubrobacterales bacterium]